MNHTHPLELTNSRGFDIIALSTTTKPKGENNGS